MDFGVTIDLFLERGHILDGSPTGDVSILAGAEDAVEQSRGTEEANMPTMKRRDRSANRRLFLRQ